METKLINIDTSRRKVVDLTPDATSFCAGKGDGLLNLFAPHSTVGLAIMELGSRSDRDLEDALNRLLPREHPYAHAHGSPGHGADHLVPAFLAPSLTVPVENGRPLLGTWQSIVLVDLNVDNPERQVRLSFVAG
ncbi:MAG TPA: secondary thiamine-phosphate synthase enzyme YjbQ [Dehalococcoidia bacterium]|nr:secondary thiamine-phosphate synthase enzyme YjbQ [Dehalococcoidia bacterium]